MRLRFNCNFSSFNYLFAFSPREKVARGNSVLFLRDLESNSSSHDGVIFALKKFTGGMGDEDETQPDDNFVWMKYFLKPLASARKVVCTRKANGEAAHLSVRFDLFS